MKMIFLLGLLALWTWCRDYPVAFFKNPHNPTLSGWAWFSELWAQKRTQKWVLETIPEGLTWDEWDLSLQAIWNDRLVRVFQCRPQHCEVAFKESALSDKKLWVPKKDLSQWPRDLGKAIVIKPTWLYVARKDNPQQFQPIRVEPPEAFVIVRHHSWALQVISIRNPQWVGFLDASSVVYKLLMAQYVFFQNRWWRVESLGRNTVLTPREIPVWNVEALLIEPQTWLVWDQQVQAVRKQKAGQWRLWIGSYLAPLGLVWWQPERQWQKRWQIPGDRLLPFARQVTIAGNPPVTFGVKNGVFVDPDGSGSYYQMTHLGLENWPMVADSDGTVYLGLWVTHKNHPLNFRPFWHWREIFQCLSHHPQSWNPVRLVDLQLQKPHVVLTLESHPWRWRLKKNIQTHQSTCEFTRQTIH